MRDILRTQEIEKAAHDARQKLAEAEADFNSTLAKNRTEWVEEEEAHFDRVKIMTAEIQGLEARRKAALVPVSMLEDELKEQLRLAEKKQQTYVDLVAENETLTEQLEDRLDEVAQRELEITKRSEELMRTEAVVAQQLQTSKERLTDLNMQVTQFLATKAEAEADLERRKTEVALLETSLVAKADKLQGKQKILDTTLDKIEQSKAELAAKRKEALVPVEQLKTQAAAVVAEAENERTQAQILRQEAAVILSEAKRDYQVRLDSLNDRDLALTQSEKAAADWQERNLVKHNELRELELAYTEKLDSYLAKEEKLEESITLFAKEKADVMTEANARLSEAELKEQDAQDMITRAQETFATAEALTEQMRIRGAELDVMQREIRSERSALAIFKKQVTVLAESQQASLVSLNQERESFAVWRSEAETAVENKAMANATLEQVLADKDTKLKSQEKFLADWATRLADQRDTLQRGFDELTKKQKK